MKIRNLSLLLIGSVLFAVAAYGGLLLYLTWPISEVSIDKSGVFGDSFGVLTSLFSGLAFAGLIITIIMQRDELALQREELTLTRQELSEQKEELIVQNETMRVQRFENTFFNMLELLESSRNDIVIRKHPDIQLHGRDAMKDMYCFFVDHRLHGMVNDGAQRVKAFKEECKTIEGIKEVYSEFYAEKYGEELGPYFRTLYNILKLVDRNESINDKTVYTNLVRAQLSRYELSLLFYNGLSEFGDKKMAPLIRKFHILKHMEYKYLPKEHSIIWEEFNA